MNALAWSYRLAAGTLLGLALFGAVSYALLLAGMAFAAALLPAALLLGCALASPHRLPPARDRAPVPRWLMLTTGALLAVLGAGVGWGALATPSRHWDGVVAWEAKADALSRDPRLDQDYFTHPEVFCHTTDYPPLQPLCIAAGNRLLGDGAGRALFPLLYLVLAALVGVAVRVRSERGWLGPLAALAVATTPMLAGPTMGGADSGYAELFLAVCVAGIAAALVLEDRRTLMASCFLAVLVKPEGGGFAALPVVILWCLGARAAMRAALAGWLAGGALWLPLQHRLIHAGNGSSALPTAWLGLTAIAALVVASDHALHRPGARPRLRLAAGATAIPLALLALPLLALALGNEGGTIAAYLGDGFRPLARLPRLPAITLGFFEHAVWRLKFALTFALPLVLFATLLVRRRCLPTPALSSFVMLGMLSVFAAFLLSPVDDLEHLMRSSMSRLLLHWTGAAWIASGVWLGDVLALDAQHDPLPRRLSVAQPSGIYRAAPPL